MYRTIETSIWFDPKVQALPAPGKLLFIYLITNPHGHVSGIYYLPDLLVQGESGLKPEVINTLWDTLSGAELARRDREMQVVWVKNMLKHQGGHQKLFASAANHLGTLHNSCLVQEFVEYYPSVKKLMKRKGMDRVSKSGRTCLKEQEQEQEQEQEGAAPLSPEVGDGGELITSETVYRAYPKHVEPEPSKKSIAEAVRYLRKHPNTPTPWAWLLGRVRLYADARSELERTYPGANRFIPACHRWMKRKRFEEDPVVWPTEVPGFASGNGTSGEHRRPRESVRKTVVHGEV